MSDAAIALNRFGLGGRLGEPPPAQPKAWLLDQFDRFEARPAAIAAAPDRAKVAGTYVTSQAELHATLVARKAQMAAGKPLDAEMKDPGLAASPAKQPANVRFDYFDLTRARVANAVDSATPFVDRLVHFWANHFAVSADKRIVTGLTGLLEFEAVRPHVLGRFADLLKAVEWHPAMLLYLDQAQSIGPKSVVGLQQAALRRAQGGLNENLAREILELHTLGVRSVYDQADVTELARALTGRMVTAMTDGPAAQLGTGAAGTACFAADIHEPGARRIIGKTYRPGDGQADAILDDLAVHPATARHVATKLAAHFCGDRPPSLVTRLERSFLDSGGDLPTLYRTLIEAPEPWTAGAARFKTPWDWQVSALRAIGSRNAPAGNTAGFAQLLGQPIWEPGSPAGYDDADASWIGSAALSRRVAVAERLTVRVGPDVDVAKAAPDLLPGALGPTTVRVLKSAASSRQAFALLLVSPEFLRR